MTRWIHVLWCTLVLVSGVAALDDVNRLVRERSEPEYPEIAQKMNLHGTVKLRVWVGPDGVVRRLEYLGGHPLLAESALKAVKTWRFVSAPKETSSVIEVKF